MELSLRLSIKRDIRATDKAAQLALLYRARAPLAPKGGLDTCQAGGMALLPYC